MLVDWGDEGVLPCHVWCFVDLTRLDSGTKSLQFGGANLKKNVYAVVETTSYDENEEEIAMSDIFIPLHLDVEELDEDGNVVARQFYLADVEAIVGPCAVIPNIGGDKTSYLQVKKREEWCEIFEQWLRKPHVDDVMVFANKEKENEGGGQKEEENVKKK